MKNHIFACWENYEVAWETSRDGHRPRQCQAALVIPVHDYDRHDWFRQVGIEQTGVGFVEVEFLLPSIKFQGLLVIHEYFITNRETY
jgi:hypothetical protein